MEEEKVLEKKQKYTLPMLIYGLLVCSILLIILGVYLIITNSNTVGFGSIIGHYVCICGILGVVPALYFLNRMTKRYNLTEKVISIILILWGLVSSYSYWTSTIRTFHIGIEVGRLTWKTVEYLTIFKNFHFFFILSIGPLISGILLLLNRMSGWLLSILLLFLTAVVHLIRTITFYRAIAPRDSVVLLYVMIMSLICFILFIILLSPPYRLKYKPTNKIWWVMSAIASVAILDFLFWAK